MHDFHELYELEKKGRDFFGESMAERSLRASEAGVRQIRKAMNRDGWTQQNLTDSPDLKVKRGTIGNFANGKPVERWIFQEACRLLDLVVKDVAEPEEETPAPSIVELVSKARSQIQTYTQERCGTMRVLDMTQPIGLDRVYIQVNILEKLTRLRSTELAELLREGSLENFDRFCIGNVQQKRVPGLEAVEKSKLKLMILGKPGAGKTTFLKHLAMQCIGGEFQGDRVPFFITLKEFAEEDGKPGLLEFCDRLVGMGAIELFRNGRALVLLDGLDEVREADASRVLRQIQQFSVQFPGNQFVITCRIAAREYTFEQFTEVEVADFSPEQVAEFVSNWFRHKNDPVKAKRFLKRLKDEKPIAELATSPLLLTLLCLVFEDSGSFPSNRAELYGTGVEVLLKKWDTKRNIDREQVYQGLSLKRKEDLLSWVARSTFEAGNYFFKQREAERLIGEYIQNLPNADPAALEVDSGAVLKAIEAQHGLFVERARQIYSFSHLTFHEYFAARGIVEARDPAALQALATHIIEPRWREVVLRVAELLPNADDWLRMMQAEVDSLLARDEKLQAFLRWVDEKARSVAAPYKPAAVRAFYFAHAHALDHALDHDLNLDHAHDLNLDNDLALALDLAHDLAHDFALDLAPEFQRKLKELRDRPPDDSLFSADLDRWWGTNGEAWRAELRAVMIEHRNIGHDWQFTEEQEDRLEQYYDANRLLIDCLNSECYVSREVRQEIEDTLLLPIAEIEKRRNP